LIFVLSLGIQYVTDFPDTAGDVGLKAPLELVLCDKKSGGCGLLQLSHTTKRDLLYREYWYKSGINLTMRKALSEIVERAESLVSLGRGDIVVDIGANDGTLLRAYTRPGLKLVGFEPAKNLLPEACVDTTKIIDDFFSFDGFAQHFSAAKSKVITSIAMFYDLDEPNAFVADVAKLLSEDGLWIIQMNYLPLMLELNAFDNISHEHLEYYSLSSLESLLWRHNLEVFDIELNEVNGGSIRAYVRHINTGTRHVGESEVLKSLREVERKMRLDDRRTYEEFATRINRLKSDVINFVTQERSKGKKIYVYGASTRGNVVLQYFGLDNRLIEAAAERNPRKWGKRTVGTNIPIISEEEARSRNPDYFLILPWQFLPEFLVRERRYLESGGKFVLALPRFKLIGREDLDVSGYDYLSQATLLSWYREQRRIYPFAY
jgi:hypothetical protein